MRTTKDVKQNKGITLIALVITIIVMLILVAVTITMAVNGGLFDYASSAGRKTNNAVELEQEYANLEANMTVNQLIDKYSGTKTPQEPEEPEEPVTPEGGDDEVALSEINVGDYISNYPVEYTNVVDIDDQKYTKWRVLSVDESGVKLISAGVPLTYSTEIGSVIIDYDSVVANLTTGFLTTPVNSETIEAYKFNLCGFSSNNLTSVFTNNFTNKVQSLTYGDVLNVTGEVDMYIKSVSSNDLLAIPQEGSSSNYIGSILAERTTIGDGLWLIGDDGIVYTSYTFYSVPVRPVVTLKPGVIFKEATTNINSTPTYEIELPEQN